MPNWCENTVHFEHTDSKAIKEVKEAFKEEKLCNYFIPISVDETNNDWYINRVSKWGTKWDVGDDGGNIALDNDEHALTIHFSSAWSPPTGVYEEAENKGFTVSATYCEPCMDFIGEFVDGEDHCYYLSKAPQHLKDEYEWAYEEWDDEED